MSQLIRSISQHISLGKHSNIFEIGCAQGLSLYALKEMGYRNVSGIEPSQTALRSSTELSKQLKLKIRSDRGYAEKLPLKDCSIDFIFAQSVLEHVSQDKKVFQECYKVLKKGGGLYFSSTSICCPAQSEIRFFPFFSWYPDILKKKIMNWSIAKFPALVGYTDTPAFNWYSCGKIKRMARVIGYRRIIDRWDLAASNNGKGGFKSRVKWLISKNLMLRFVGNLLFQGAEYLLIK